MKGQWSLERGEPVGNITPHALDPQDPGHQGEGNLVPQSWPLGLWGGEGSSKKDGQKEVMGDFSAQEKREQVRVWH